MNMKITEGAKTLAPPGEGLKTEKMPGHWVLARLGKRVLRPGGMQLTRLMLKRLDIRPSDDVIEFAPGMGATARLTLALAPSSYTAVERDEAATKIVGSYLTGPGNAWWAAPPKPAWPRSPQRSSTARRCSRCRRRS